MKKMVFWLSLLLVMVLLAGSLIACSSSPSTSAPATSKAPAPTSAAPAPTTSAPAPATTTAAAKPSTSAPAQKITLRFGTPGPAEHPGTLAMIDWANKFNAAAGGRYEMKVFPGGTLSASLDQMNAIRTGAEDMGDAATNFYAGDDPAFEVMDVPFLFNNVDAQASFGASAVSVLDAVAQKKFNQKLITTFVYGKKDIYTVSKQVKTLADWKGLLVSINTPLESDMVKALGGAPVLIDWADELPSLQKGLINAGIISSLAGLAPMGYGDVIKYLTVANMKGGMGFIAINLDVWKAMPKDIQDLMMSTSADFTASFNKAFKQGETVDWPNQLKAKGVTIYQLPNDERANWIKATQPLSDKYWAGLPADTSAALKDAIAKANAKNP